MKRREIKVRKIFKMDPTKCFLCEKPFEGGETEFIGKGIPNIISASKARNDGKFEQLKNVEIIHVHKSCKRDYTNKSSIKKLFQKPNETESKFDFKNNCFYCGTDVTPEAKKSINRRRRVHICTQTGMKKKIVQRAMERNDELGNQVLNRIEDVNLVILKACYHKDCNIKFFYTSSKFKKGRPVDKNLDKAFQKVCDFINNSEERKFTLKSLLEKVENNLPDNGTMSMKTLKSKLEKKYGDGMVFAISGIKPSVMYFLDSGLKRREELVKEKQIIID